MYSFFFLQLGASYTGHLLSLFRRNCRYRSTQSTFIVQDTRQCTIPAIENSAATDRHETHQHRCHSDSSDYSQECWNSDAKIAVLLGGVS